MDDPDPSEEPSLNTGTPWSSWEDEDIRWGLDHNSSIEEIADFLCRRLSEVRQRIGEIEEADAIGDPSLLRDRMTDRECAALETYRDARAALALIREAVEDCAPPDSVALEQHWPFPTCARASPLPGRVVRNGENRRSVGNS
jgi:hypothetical protein